MSMQNEEIVANKTKIPLPEPEYENARYANAHHILRSEAIYGHGFQSPGGLEGFKSTLLDHMPDLGGKTVVDIGSGLGGAAIYIAQMSTANVVGIDSAASMVELSTTRKNQTLVKGSVNFVEGDIFMPALKPESIDIIYTKDVLMYDANKNKTFKRCYDLLAPGGSLCISDFTRINTNPDFASYIDVSKYDLLDMEAYRELIEAVGFEIHKIKDVSDLALFFLESDLYLYRAKVSMGTITAHSDDVEHVVERWLRKINFLSDQLLGQILLIATKPKR